MAWPDETSVATGTTAGGTAWRSARVYPNGSTDRSTVAAPTALVDGAPIRLVIAFHGTGGSDGTMDSGNGAIVRDALLDEGYVVVAANLGGNTWGNAEAMGFLSNLYDWCSTLWEVTDTVLFGQSQGGGVAWVSTRRGLFPTLRGVVGVAPAINFQWVSDSGSSSPAIRTAYGADASTFAALSADYAPFSGTRDDYAGVHFKLWASPDDTTTPNNLHANRFVSLGLAAKAASIEVVTVTGAHLSAEHYVPADVVSFYENAITVGNVIPPFSEHTARVWDGNDWELKTVYDRDGSNWVPHSIHSSS